MNGDFKIKTDLVIDADTVVELLRRLPPRERLRVVAEVLPGLEDDLPPTPASPDFWADHDIGRLATEQGIEPVSDPSSLLGGWPEDEYVSSYWSMAAINTTTRAVSYNPAEFRPMITDIALGADGYLYVLLHDEIQVVEPRTWEPIVSTGEMDNLYNCSTRHIQAMASKAFVSCFKKAAIMLYDVATNTVDQVELPGLYDRIAGLSRGKLYLVSADGETVLVLDTQSNQVLAQILLPSGK